MPSSSKHRSGSWNRLTNRLRSRSPRRSFARPGDNRAAGFLHMAAKRFEPGWITRLSIIGIFVLAGVLTLIGVRKHFASGLSVSQARGPSCWTGTPCERGCACIFRMLSADTFAALVGSLNDKLTDSAMRQRLIFIATMLLYQVWHDLHAIATSGRMVGGLALAAATGVVLGVVGSRSARMTMHWPSPVRLGIVGFCGILAVCLVIDGCLVTRRRDVLLERMVGEYPDSFWGRLVQGERERPSRRDVRAGVHRRDHRPTRFDEGPAGEDCRRGLLGDLVRPLRGRNPQDAADLLGISRQGGRVHRREP